MGLSIYTEKDGKSMGMSYGHFGGFVDEITDWCRENANPSEDEERALCILENYSIDGTEIDAETCKHLFNCITRQDENGAGITGYFWELYTEDCFDYRPFKLYAVPYDDWKWNGKPQQYFRGYSKRTTFTRSLSGAAWEAHCYIGDHLNGGEEPGEYKEYLQAVDLYFEYINSEDDEHLYDFSPPKGGMEQGFLTAFIEILADAAINGKTLHLG